MMSSTRRSRRRFQPIKVDALGYESGQHRFTTDGLVATPPISPFRNNLTALSQRFNLYFVASVENIHVYVPEFYSQSLGNTPKLVLSPPLANPDAEGYLDEQRPHGINHIVVGDLGTDEVLVLATDSGNVAAYHTRTIAQALQRNESIPLQAPSDDDGIRPFFTHWVFESAWGIAIHKAARLIAISANIPHRVESEELTAKITVFAFALTSRGKYEVEDENSSDESLAGPEIEEWVEFRDSEALHRQLFLRNRNLKITLSEHVANIPNISFVNNHYDRQGKFLIATDINGEMKVWRIWDREVLRSYDFSDGAFDASTGRREVERGWNVLALDPASFRTMSTVEEFCGESDPSEYFPTSNGSYVGGPFRETYRLNGGTLSFFNDDDSSSQDFEEDDHNEHSEDEDDEEEAGGVSLLESDEDLHQFEAGHEIVHNHHEQAVESDPEISPEELIPTNTITRRSRIASRTSQPGAPDPNLQALLSADHSQRPAMHRRLNEGGTSTMTITANAEEDSAGGTSDTGDHITFDDNASPYQLLSPQSQLDALISEERAFSPTNQNLLEFPTIPVLHFSLSNIRLTNTPAEAGPHIMLNNPCAQYFPPSSSWMYHMDRLNMVAYLPEMGLVIAASQTGKVAVITLTRRAQTGCTGCRLDWVLPYPDQEHKKQRPLQPLLGLAVAPMQGQYSSSNGHDAPSTPEEEAEWGTDQVVDGILRTFDSTFLDLDAVTSPSSSPSGDSDSDSDSPQSYQSFGTNPRHTQSQSFTPSRRKTLSPKSRVYQQQPQSMPSPRQQLTPPHTQSSPKKARTDSSASFQPSTRSKKQKQLHHRGFPIVSVPWSQSTPPISANSNSSTSEPKRYRLMLTYYDHTVLSYEIRRIDGRVGLWGSTKRNWGNREDLVL